MYSSSVTRAGITWTFDKPYRGGVYANGDPWVLGPVLITAMTPARQYQSTNGGPGICTDYWQGESFCQQWCQQFFSPDSASHCDGVEQGSGSCVCESIHHGWEVNPTPRSQAFDDRAGSVDGTAVPSLPYLAQPGESIVKTVSLAPLEDRSCRPCLQSAAVLTVLDTVPVRSGCGVLRPPYVGQDKPTYTVASIRTSLLPSLPAVTPAPTLAEVHDWFAPVQLDHMPGRTSTLMRPQDSLPFYAADIAQRTASGALRLMLDEPIHEKLPALLAYLQTGLDYYHFTLEGQLWPPGGGEQPGNKLPIVFFAALLGDDTIKDTVRTLELYEDFHAHYSADLVALFGNLDWSVYDGLNEYAYWQLFATGAGSKTRMDPYLYIDGGLEPGGSYQYCCTSQPFKGAVLSLHLMPALQDLWYPEELVDYVDRWVSLGAWTQPDPCAPVDGRCVGGTNPGAVCTQASAATVCTGDGASCDLSVFWDPTGTLGRENHYGITYGPDPGNPGECIHDSDPSDGIGRFPALDGVNPDGGHRYSTFGASMWQAYRGPSCYDGVCEPGETCPYDCS